MGGWGKEKEIIMYNYDYVTKNEALPVKKELIKIINQVQDIVREHFTFNFYFIGSSSRNMITQDVRSNIGFDFDVNIEVNDDEQNYSAEEIRRIIQILARKTKNNVILIGEPGVGKTAIIEGLSERIVKEDVPFSFSKDRRQVLYKAGQLAFQE